MASSSATYIGEGRQLFLDDSLIESSSGVEFHVHKPKKTGDRCIYLEGISNRRIGGYSSVLFYEGLYRLYYTELLLGSEDIGIVVKYAESKDGIVWKTPDLMLAKEADGGRNNIILGMGANSVSGFVGDGSCTVFIDENAKKNERFKMLARPRMKWPMALFSSEDGIKWEKCIDRILDDNRKEGTAEPRVEGQEIHLDSQNIMFWDESIKKYVAYVRRNFEKKGQYRTIARCESSELKPFPPVWEMDVVYMPDKLDRSLAESSDLPVVDFYTNATIKYPWADNAYFMFPTLYFKYGSYLSEYGEKVPVNAGPVDTRFASSRDGVIWNKYDRTAFVGLGMKGEFDDSSIYLIHGIVPGKDDKMYLYYLGMDMLHGWGRGDKFHGYNNELLSVAGHESKKERSVISRLELRKDGFVSIKGEYTGGCFTTKPVVFSGNKLFLNLNTSANGTLRVGIMDEQNIYIDGYKLADCDLIHTSNEINRVVSFNGNTDLSRLAGKRVKLFFELYDTDLYAMQFKQWS